MAKSSIQVEGIVYRKNGGARIVKTEVGAPGPHEVQLETVACGICQLDQYCYKRGVGEFPFPLPNGHEGVSYITKIGPGVEGLKVGDRVSGGSFARVSNVKAEKVYRIPDSTVPDELWIVEPVSCVVTGIDTSALLPGQRVALIGSGFMGMLLVQGLSRMLLDRLVVMDINPKRLEMAQAFGADAVYNPADKGFEAQIRRLRKQEFDTVIETSGTQAGLDLAEQITRTGGRINLFGWVHGRGAFTGNHWHLGGFTVVNSTPFGKIRDTNPAAIRLIRKGAFDLRPLVTHVVEFREYLPLLKSIAAGHEPDYIKGVVKLDGRA